jgi:hypothetical protein
MTRRPSPSERDAITGLFNHRDIHADLAGRVGRDELLLVLPNTGAEGALQLSQRLQEIVVAIRM